MSNASTRVKVQEEPWDERWPRWFAALMSALLHVLMVLVLLYATTPKLTPPQGAATGGRVKVDFIGETSLPEQPTPAPPSPPPVPTRTPPTASPVQSTLVAQSDDPVPADEVDTLDTPPVLRPPDDAAQRQTQAPAASPPAPARRRPEIWTGRPPGYIEEDVAQDDGMARSNASRGNQRDVDAAEPSMEVGGYQVYYDLRSENRLRTWMSEGIKELSLPLPGTRFYMVCPAQVALDRGSGKCRLLAPDSPELKTIGDARDVIDMIQVYRQGELVWRGPGPYR